MTPSGLRPPQRRCNTLHKEIEAERGRDGRSCQIERPWQTKPAGACGPGGPSPGGAARRGASGAGGADRCGQPRLPEAPAAVPGSVGRGPPGARRCSAVSAVPGPRAPGSGLLAPRAGPSEASSRSGERVRPRPTGTRVPALLVWHLPPRAGLAGALACLGQRETPPRARPPRFHTCRPAAPRAPTRLCVPPRSSFRRVLHQLGVEGILRVFREETARNPNRRLVQRDEQQGERDLHGGPSRGAEVDR